MKGVGSALGRILGCCSWAFCSWVFILIPLQGSPLEAESPRLRADSPAALEWPVTANRFTATDLFELEYAADPRISPDGSRVIFAREVPDVTSDVWKSNLWLVSTDSGSLRALTTGPQADITPRWSPDGQRVAFISNRDGSLQIYVLRLSDGHLNRLTRLEKAPSRLAWSPDGQRLAFAALESRPPPPLIDPLKPPAGARWAEPPLITDRLVYRTETGGYLDQGVLRLYVISASGGPPRRVTRDDAPFHEVPVDPLNVHSNKAAPAWTPDGKFLLTSANRRPDWELRPIETEILEHSLADGTIRTLTHRQGPDASPVASPDGRWIAYIGHDDHRRSYEVTRLHLMDRDGSQTRVLTAKLDRGVRGPRWTSDSRGLLFQYHDRGTTKIAHVDLKGRVRELSSSLSDGGGAYGGGSFTLASSGHYAFNYSRALIPGEVGLASLDDPTIRVLTSLNKELMAGKKLGEVEELSFVSRRDQRPIQGWVIKPPDFDPRQRYPLIIEIHGGPFRDYGDRFDPEKQIWAAMGYLVLYINQRGSVGYGQEFGNLIHHAYPGNDLHDLEAAVDHVIERGWADPNNLFVTGGSGGAMLACWMTAHSDRYRAAVAAYPLVNWTTFALTSDLSALATYYWFPGLPWEQPEAYMKRSPLWRVGDVETPTMLIVGGADYRTPASEAEQYYTALKYRGVDTRLVRFENAPHFAERSPSHQIYRVLLTLGWFNRYRIDSKPVGPDKK